jgi:hypothetical protein
LPNTACNGYPLVLFSHGGLAIQSSNESLYLELASHGYVVCSIGHPYHALWTTDENGRITWVSMDYFWELQQEDASRNKVQSYHYYQKWMETRMGDSNFVLDRFLKNAADREPGVSPTDQPGVPGFFQLSSETPGRVRCAPDEWRSDAFATGDMNSIAHALAVDGIGILYSDHFLRVEYVMVLRVCTRACNIYRLYS